MADPSPAHPDAWGIAAGYHDAWGRWTEPSPEAIAALRRAMGAATDDPAERPAAGTALRVVRQGAPATTEVTERAWLTLEDGSQLRVRDGHLPPDLPLGYHRVEADTGRSAPHVEHVIVAPDRAHLPEGWRAWGITAQLYAARSSTSWGIGDTADLGRLVGWLRARGGQTIGLNPLHAATPAERPPDSPYSPSSRCFHDPIYLDVPAVLRSIGRSVPGAEAAAAVGRALAAGDRIDRAAVWALKHDVLERAWAATGDHPGLDAYRAARGGALDLWATFCAIAERHGPSWPQWPAELRHPHGPAVGRFARDAADRVDFWAWLQFLVDGQLEAVGAGDHVVTDLAVGFAPDGFDAWRWQDLLATGVRIGAPPDVFGPEGQDWGLPPFVPHRLRGVAYAPLAETLRANLRTGRGLRIDHVMGLLRLFWIPPDHGPRHGAYVAWPGTELVDVVALESVRAGALVVGEDLGTVEPGVRELLGERGLLSTRLLWFEDRPPAQWPTQAMAAVTTHDLPTVAGLWTGVDLADQRAAGVEPQVAGDAELRHRLRVAAHAPDDAPLDQVVVAAHAALGAGPSMLATAALDDLVGAEHRANLPGTIDQHPNWRIPLPLPLDELDGHPRAEAVVAALAAGRQQPPA
jgi:4-alpha-glucanotransferase